MGLFDMIGGVASGLGSAAQGYMNWQAQNATNAANIQMNEANNAQNLALTQQGWARDDTAVQRRTADLRAAGINPVLAAGQAAQTSAPIAMQAARIAAPQMSGMHGAIDAGVKTFAGLVQAREVRRQAEATTEAMDVDNQIRKSNLDKLSMEKSLIREQQALAYENMWEKRYNNYWYSQQGLPTNSTGMPKDLAQARELIKNQLKHVENFKSKGRAKGTNWHDGMLASTIDMLGGTD